MSTSDWYCSDAKNVVVFGESGGGKSSTVNLLMGKNVANVSDKAVGCTFEFQQYKADNYMLFDTVGLSEGRNGTVDQTFAVRQLIELLKSLEGGVSLLVFVMEKGRIKKSLDENYKLFVDAICMKKVPVVLMITHCEMEEVTGTWWKENKMHFEKYGMNYNAVVSGCCMDPANAPAMMRPHIAQMNSDTVSNLKTVIASNMLTPGWQVKGGWKTWFETIMKTVWKIILSFFGIQGPSIEPSFKERLYDYFKTQGYEDLHAKQMARDIATAIK